MFAAALTAAMTGVCDVTSSNCVGYNSTDMYTDGKFTTVVVPFLNVTDANKGLSIYDITIANVTKNNLPANADQIWIWQNGISWDKYFINTSGQWKQTTGAKTEFSVIYPNGLPEGTAIYLKTKGSTAKTVTGSGAVDTVNDEVSATLFADGKFTYFGNPFPTVTKISDGEQFSIANVTKNNLPANADQVWIWQNGISWDKYFINTSGVWKQTTGAKTDFSVIYPDGLPVGTPLYIKTKGSATNKEAVFTRTFSL